VVDNLVDNAVDASPEGGTVFVGGRVVDGQVQVLITDQGRGMTPEERLHAFDRFWRSPRAKPGGGSGLGLAIVDRLVRGSGGEVRLEDAPGGGLRAVVVLPAGH